MRCSHYAKQKSNVKVRVWWDSIASCKTKQFGWKSISSLISRLTSSKIPDNLYFYTRCPNWLKIDFKECHSKFKDKYTIILYKIFLFLIDIPDISCFSNWNTLILKSNYLQFQKNNYLLLSHLKHRMLSWVMTIIKIYLPWSWSH